MTTFTITRKAQQTYNQRVTDHYEDTKTITLAELLDHHDWTEQEWRAMPEDEQQQHIEEYATDEWFLENVVKTEDDGWAEWPDEHYEEELEIVRHQQPA
jgi:hypothetical protein